MESKEEMSMLQQLMYLKGLTVRTGSIHEAQALQLRNWGLLIPGVKTSTAKIDCDHQMVTFILTSKSKNFRTTEMVKSLCSNINVWTKKILWDNTTVIIECGKRTLFDSRAANGTTKG